MSDKTISGGPTARDIEPHAFVPSAGLLMWLRQRRDEMRVEVAKSREAEDHEMAVYWEGSAEAYNEVIQHISFGGAS